MMGAWVIAKKDIKAFFSGTLFYVLVGLCSVIWLGIFVASLSSVLHRGIQPEDMETHQLVYSYMGVVGTLFMFFVPFVTMWLIAEEKKNRTFDLLLTAPLSAAEITLGKFFSGLIIMVSALMVALLSLLALVPFVSFEWGPFFASLLGLFLWITAFVALGILASSLTSNLFVALAGSLFLNFGLLILGVFEQMSTTDRWMSVTQQIHFMSHVENFLMGNVTVSGLIFLLSIVFFALFLTERVIESARWR